MKCFFTAFIFALALPGGQSESKTVTGTAGQSITLNTGATGLHGDHQILWSYGPEDHLLVDSDGKEDRIKSKRYQLDRETGSLTILSLSPDDAGSYKGQIINGDGSTHNFQLIVQRSSPDSAADQKTHVVAVLAVAVGVVLFF